MANLAETIKRPHRILQSVRAIRTAGPVNMGADNPGFTSEFREKHSLVAKANGMTYRSSGLFDQDQKATVIELRDGEEYLTIIDGVFGLPGTKRGQLWAPQTALEIVGLAGRDGRGGDSKGAKLRAMLSGDVTRAWEFKGPSIGVYRFSEPGDPRGFAVFISRHERVFVQPTPIFYAINEPGRRILGL